mgnify:CR=1 FL=1
MLDLILPKDKKTPEGTYTVADAVNDNYGEYTFVPGYYVGITAVRKGTWCYEHYPNDSNDPDIVAPTKADSTNKSFLNLKKTTER